MRVRGEVRDDLVGGDALRDGALDGGFGEAARDEVREARGEAREKVQDADLEDAVRVGVEAVVGFDDDVAFAVVC